ncbi:MAG TPA: S8 family serine peptidase [Actinomycetota bacterium]|nr:S8 family serine peptidase [Actinomycetota bacterium]
MKRPVLTSLAAAFLSLVLAAPAYATTDPGRSQQWGLTKIHADQAWTKAKGAGITIAIVDTGIDLTHPDLKAHIASHYDCTSGSCVGGATAGNDDNGHGSHVAGIAAAVTGNGVGVAGVAPSAKLMAVKVLDSSGSGNCSNIVTGIRFASDHGARVINLSLGPETGLLDFILGNSCVQDLQNAAAYAYGRGDVVVIAAGNQSLKSAYNSSALEVVGATGPNDEVASYSNTGANVYAPGGDASGQCQSSTNCILSTWMNGGYALDQGTSMAAPHVSGLAALLLSEGYTNAQAVARINSTADNVNGVERINAMRAVGATSSSGGGGSTPTPTPTRHHSSGTPTPTASNPAVKPSSPAKTVAPPSANPSSSVLAVTPTISPSPTVNAAGPSASTAAHSRATQIGLAAFAIVVVAFATARALARRRSV